MRVENRLFTDFSSKLKSFSNNISEAITNICLFCLSFREQGFKVFNLKDKNITLNLEESPKYASLARYIRLFGVSKLNFKENQFGIADNKTNTEKLLHHFSFWENPIKGWIGEKIVSHIPANDIEGLLEQFNGDISSKQLQWVMKSDKLNELSNKNFLYLLKSLHLQPHLMEGIDTKNSSILLKLTKIFLQEGLLTQKSLLFQSKTEFNLNNLYITFLNILSSMSKRSQRLEEEFVKFVCKNWEGEFSSMITADVKGEDVKTAQKLKIPLLARDLSCNEALEDLVKEEKLDSIAVLMNLASESCIDKLVESLDPVTHKELTDSWKQNPKVFYRFTDSSGMENRRLKESTIDTLRNWGVDPYRILPKSVKE